MSKPIIYVYDTAAAGGTDYVAVGQLADYTDMTFTRGWAAAGSFAIKINRNNQGAAFLQQDRIIYLDAKRVGYIDSVEIDQKDNLSNDFLIVSGVELKDNLVRWTIPPTGEDTDSYTAEKTETVAKGLLNKNAGPGAVTERQLPGLAIATDQERGSTIDFSTRHKDLSSEIITVLAQDRMGLTCEYDPDAETSTFDVAVGTDRTEGQSVNNQIILSVDWKTAKAYSYKKDKTSFRNLAIVAGQGEGKDRTIVAVYSDASEPEGYSRRELFVDARDVASDDELTDRGAQKLAETAIQTGILIDYNDLGAYTIDDDFECGDYVTAKSDISTDDMQVVAVSYKYMSDIDYPEIGLVLDFDPDDETTAISRKFKTLDSLLSSESSGAVVEDNLTSTSTTNALSANQGRVLDDSKINISDKTGSDAGVVSGTAGAENKLAMWNADGDLVDAGFIQDDIKGMSVKYFQQTSVANGAYVEFPIGTYQSGMMIILWYGAVNFSRFYHVHTWSTATNVVNMIGSQLGSGTAGAVTVNSGTVKIYNSTGYTINIAAKLLPVF